MKSKKAFMLGAAMAATCFVSAFALAEQYPHLAAQAAPPAVKQGLKSAAKVKANKATAALKQQLLAGAQQKKTLFAPKAKADSVVEDNTAPARVTKLQKTTAQSAPAVQAALVQGCEQTLDINSLYTIDGVQTGDLLCYHFNLPQKARINVLLVNQTAGTDMSLSLFQDDGQGNPLPLGTSNNPGTGDESLGGVVPAGDYYWFMEANAAVQGSSFQFGVAVDTNLDAFEPNDTPDTAFQLPDTLNYINGNADSLDDVDYFDFTAVRGQSVGIALTADATSGSTRNKWILERFDGAQWVTVGANVVSTSIPSPGVGGVVKVRVRPNQHPNEPWSATGKYNLSFGSNPRVNSPDVKGEANVLRIPYSASDVGYGYMTTQAYRDLTWTMGLSDSTGAPLVGLHPIVYLDQRIDPANGDIVYKAYSAATDSAGQAAGTINVGTCFGDFQTTFVDYAQGYNNTWRTDFNYGVWRMEVLEYPGIGVGGDNTEFVSFGHLCKQTLLSSTKS
ncbi:MULTISPECIES: hypothetical protein [Pseudomonas]|uniref:hypothetical protein n=1 Tax=Pseudomonas TaxID=286 RepID=UPI0004822F7B|nr:MULTISPECIES: hypothetical protein [Pseudomonas]KAA8554922.1 hypothetical protein FX984_01540 [Pseudomonas marginalis]NMZ92887.1 hypothetical protein [Pseudomonas marginalis]PUB43387.1 hypothetical protein C8K58_107273 [Pseudomonas sp. GV047]TWR69375.1 hypothetical protein FIV40_16560 [Pseudomonas marginalis]SMF55703.1 hypothetical protein SAMN05660912_04418 [Pseudomonas sp. LAMO17WK12:I1]